MRIASFLVPLFPLAARLRSEPELVSEAVAVVEGNGNAAHVIAATRRARKGGIRPGLSLPQARAIMPKLIARARDAECERAAQEALLEVADKFSPRVEDAGNGMVYLDLHGVTLSVVRCPSTVDLTSDNGQRTTNNGESHLAHAAIATAKSFGLPLRVGIASSKLAARVAAELPETPTVVPPGEEATFLAPLPLTRLAPEIEAATMLDRWGIASIGDLARLPEADVASRLGEAGRDLLYAARGIDVTPIIPRHPPPIFREGMELEWPLVTLEPFLFVANAALDRLARRLELDGFACKRIELSLRLEPDGFDERALELPAPTRDVKTMLTLLRLDLEARPPGAPLAGFRFVAHPDRPRRAQLSIFGPPALSPDKLATTIARIASIVGPDRIGTPAAVDSYAPEEFSVVPYDPPSPPEMRKTPRRGRGLLAVRVLRPPVALEVIANGDALVSIASETIKGRIKVASGPWHLEDGWWRDAPIARDYWDVELLSGGIYRVYREQGSGGWFADGVYD